MAVSSVKKREFHIQEKGITYGVFREMIMELEDQYRNQGDRYYVRLHKVGGVFEGTQGGARIRACSYLLATGDMSCMVFTSSPVYVFRCLAHFS